MSSGMTLLIKNHVGSEAEGLFFILRLLWQRYFLLTFLVQLPLQRLRSLVCRPLFLLCSQPSAPVLTRAGLLCRAQTWQGGWPARLAGRPPWEVTRPFASSEFHRIHNDPSTPRGSTSWRSVKVFGFLAHLMQQPSSCQSLFKNMSKYDVIEWWGKVE